MSAHDSTPIRIAGTWRIPVVLTLCALLSSPLLGSGEVTAQEGGRPLTIEDFYSIRTIATPVISHDGDWVAYSVVSRVEEDNSSSSEVWVAATSGDPAPRRISPAGVQAASPAWGPDGLLRYVSGESAFAVAPDSRPGSRNVLRPEALSVIPAPNGSMVASLVAAKAPKVEVMYASDFERRHEERFDGRTWDWMYFQRDRQPLPTIDPTDPAATPPLEVAIAEAPGAPERILTDLALRPRGVSWRPDGGALVFAADSAYRDEWTYGRGDLWTVSVDGQVNRLTRDMRYSLGQPVYSPDGSRIAFVSRYATDWVIAERIGHGGPTDLMVLDPSSGESVNLTADWDLRPGAPRWSPDGGHLYFMAGIGGETHLFRAASVGSLWTTACRRSPIWSGASMLRRSCSLQTWTGVRSVS